MVQITHTLETDPLTPTTGTVVATRPRVAWVDVIDVNGDRVVEGYDLNRVTGQVTFDGAVETAPVIVRHAVSDLRMITDAQINGRLQLSRALTHPYPAHDTIVSSCLVHGDRRARIPTTWTQTSWDNIWRDSPTGTPATAQLNLIDFPMVVSNEGAETDLWALRVLNVSTNQWELRSRDRGLVWAGTYSPGGDDLAPINPRTQVWDDDTSSWVGGVPYFTLPGLANGGGWSNGNVFFFHTIGAIMDLWIAQSVAISEPQIEDSLDGTALRTQGSVDH